MTTDNGMIAFLDVIRAHLVRHALPAPVRVEATMYNSGFNIHVAPIDRVELAGDLLAWAATLEGVTAELERSSDAARVIVTLMGRLPSGHVVRVFGAIRHAATVVPDLPVRVPQELPLRVLRSWTRNQGVAA